MKKNSGVAYGGQNHLPLSIDIPFLSDSSHSPLPITSPLRQIPLAEYSMDVQPRRLGSIEPLPNLILFVYFIAKSIIFINIWQN